MPAGIPADSCNRYHVTRNRRSNHCVEKLYLLRVEGLVAVASAEASSAFGKAGTGFGTNCMYTSCTIFVQKMVPSVCSGCAVQLKAMAHQTQRAERLTNTRGSASGSILIFFHFVSKHYVVINTVCATKISYLRYLIIFMWHTGILGQPARNVI
jgi:hypothetical protein